MAFLDTSASRIRRLGSGLFRGQGSDQASREIQYSSGGLSGLHHLGNDLGPVPSWLECRREPRSVEKPLSAYKPATFSCFSRSVSLYREEVRSRANYSDILLRPHVSVGRTLLYTGVCPGSGL